ncbi:hypothetical protein [Sphingobacterium sp. LRF_L2]|uniref:hypothetical protein n=1 Tax=Sphingobacterium sp. LRF_L2 TaxID=3369421 RepID=UPI003F5E3587
MSRELIVRKSKYRTNIFCFLLVWIAFASCKGNTQSRKVLPAVNEGEKKKIIKVSDNSLDTATFLPRESAINLLSFDDTGFIKINQKNISLNLIETEGRYNFYIKKLDKILFSKKQLQGVSKVLFTDDWLLFTLYTSFSEDGANEGQAVIMSVKDGVVKIFDDVLHNTCNPVVIGEKLYLIDNLQVIESDLTFGSKRTLPITYSSASSADNPYSYLDTYLICGLSTSSDKNLLAIEFKPVRSDNACKFYNGSIAESNQILLLKER